MIAVLRQRDFALLWCAGLISMVGDWVLRIGLPLYVFKISGSTLASSAMFVAGTLPGLLFGSIAGVFVDRWDRKPTMVIANVLQAGALLPLLTVIATNHIWIVYVVVFTVSTISQFFTPAQNALLPLLVDEGQLAVANALSALNNNLARLLGPALAGLLMGLLGLSSVALIDILSFVIAAGLIMLVCNRAPSTREHPMNRGGLTSMRKIVREWREGLQVILDSPSLTVLFCLIVPIMIAEGFFGTLIVPFVTTVMHGSELDFGVLMGAQAIGGVLGSIFIARISKTMAPYRLLGICAIVFGCLDLAMFYYPLSIRGIGPGILFIGLVGIPSVGWFTARTTLLQTFTTDAYRGRVFGALGALSALIMLVSSVLAGLLGERVNLIILMTVDGLGYISAGIIALALLRHLTMPAARASQI